MEKFIPYEKLSKKEKRKLDQAKRQTWGELNPVTRKPMNSKAYHRRKSQDWKRELPPKACDFSYIWVDADHIIKPITADAPIGSCRRDFFRSNACQTVTLPI